MLDRLSDDYRQLLIESEARVKAQGLSEMTPFDLILTLFYEAKGPVRELLTSFGLSLKVFQDVFDKQPFLTFKNVAFGSYVGMSPALKELIVASLKIAASHEKRRAGVEDMLIALLKTASEPWLYRFLDFVWVSPGDFENQLQKLSRYVARHGSSPIEGIDHILHALESSLNGAHEEEEGTNMGRMSPFSGNKKSPKEESQTPALDFFAIDLTREAKIGKIDVIIGRDTEIERLISVLNRKTKNNPCLVGEPGVGKTAVVEGLARRIAMGDVPLAMQNKRVMALDLTAMVAGTKYRGEFEQRIKQVIDEASKRENEVILFIDEIHTIIGAGSGEGSLDAANILKPAMGRGKVCIIGATTLGEYQKYIEKDTALERRFQKIDIAEPDVITAKAIIYGIKESFEEFHNLVIDDSAVEDAVALSTRYITDRFLPDKAIDLIDEACATKSMQYSWDNEDVKKLRNEVDELQKNIAWFVASGLYDKALKAKERITEIDKKIFEMKQVKTIDRNLRLHISADDVQRVVERSTGIPAKNLKQEDRSLLTSLEERLKSRIIGQDTAIDSIVRSIKRSRAGIASKDRPIGSFLFLGPTGVGKTELLKVLAEEFFNDPKALIKIDMSEYQDRSSASKLIGTTAGYVGYEEGGMLTEKVRRKPYSIVLFDEIEKGNFDVFNLLLSIMEEGQMTDGKGRKVNFRNTIIAMTSNIGAEEFTSKASSIGFAVTDEAHSREKGDFERVKEKILDSLDESFSPEFLNRIDTTIVFDPLEKASLQSICRIELTKLAKRLLETNIQLQWSEKLVEHIVDTTYDPEYGARPIRRYIQDTIESRLADDLISREISGSISLDIRKGELSIAHEWKHSKSSKSLT